MESGKDQKLNLFTLVLLGVGSLIGAGVFNSPTDIILGANPQAAIIAWIIGGIGVIALAMIFQMLSSRRPQLTGGIVDYTKAGFGDLTAFISGWGYWISGLFGNVAFNTLLMKTINDLLGQTLGVTLKPIVTFILSSALLWFFVYVQTTGAKNVGFINNIVTIAKLIPLFLVLILGVTVFKPSIFFVDNWTTILASATDPVTASTTAYSQIGSTMSTILWCFIGVEAMTILATKAKRQKDVGRATVISILFTLAVYVLLIVISMGVVPAQELAASNTPLATVLSKTVLGSAGALIVKLGLILSLVGALLTWILIAAQMPQAAAQMKLFPKVFLKENKNEAPVGALIATNLIVQFFFLAMLLPTDMQQTIYGTVFSFATGCILIPYVCSVIYGFKVYKEDKGNGVKLSNLVFLIIGGVYMIYNVVTTKPIYLLGVIIVVAVGMPAYALARKENKISLTSKEKTAMYIIGALGIISIVLFATGVVQI